MALLECYTLSLHDALPILRGDAQGTQLAHTRPARGRRSVRRADDRRGGRIRGRLLRSHPRAREDPVRPALRRDPGPRRPGRGGSRMSASLSATDVKRHKWWGRSEERRVGREGRWRWTGEG